VIPGDFDYSTEATPLSTEARQKLGRLKPHTLGQASRISGVSPADISALMILLHARRGTARSAVAVDDAAADGGRS
ncbi:uncharacterized protein METZ01_LOCUS395640, partial [marine metagenome]